MFGHLLILLNFSSFNALVQTEKIDFGVRNFKYLYVDMTSD